MFGRKDKKPKPRYMRWSVGNEIKEVSRNPYGYKYVGPFETCMVVYLYTRKWDPEYPSLNAAQRIEVGECDPADTEAISALLVAAADKATTIQDALDYAERAGQSA